MAASPLNYKSPDHERRLSSVALTALICSVLCLSEVAYFWLWALIRYLPDPPESVGYVGCLSIPALAVVAAVCAAIHWRRRGRLYPLVVLCSVIALLGAGSFVWKLIVMVFLTPW